MSRFNVELKTNVSEISSGSIIRVDIDMETEEISKAMKSTIFWDITACSPLSVN
jgi:hypothetical protein